MITDYPTAEPLHACVHDTHQVNARVREVGARPPRQSNHSRRPNAHPSTPRAADQSPSPRGQSCPPARSRVLEARRALVRGLVCSIWCVMANLLRRRRRSGRHLAGTTRTSAGSPMASSTRGNNERTSERTTSDKTTSAPTHKRAGGCFCTQPPYVAPRLGPRKRRV